MTTWPARFARFEAGKSALATSARLWPYATELVEEPPDAIALESPWSSALFDGAFHLLPSIDASRPACSLVFVQSADGNTGADDPSALGGGETDTHLIYEGLSRVAADAVLAGAETVREGDIVFSVWHPELVGLRASLGLRRHPIQIVATRRGVPVERMLLCNVPEIPVILITGADGAADMGSAVNERPWISIVTLDGPQDLRRALVHLRSLGIRRISCVGGRTLAAQLLEQGLVDEIFLTTAPHPGGEPRTPISDGSWRGHVLLRKKGTGAEEGVVFEHLLPRRA